MSRNKTVAYFYDEEIGYAAVKGTYETERRRELEAPRCLDPHACRKDTAIRACTLRGLQPASLIGDQWNAFCVARSIQAFKTCIFLYFRNYNYGGGNPMRPHRVRLTHSLVDNYKLGERMTLHRPEKRSEYQISQFHADGVTSPRSPGLCDSTSSKPRLQVTPCVASTGLCNNSTHAWGTRSRLDAALIRQGWNARRVSGFSEAGDPGQSGGVHDTDAALQSRSGRGGRLPRLRRHVRVLPGASSLSRHTPRATLPDTLTS